MKTSCSLCLLLILPGLILPGQALADPLTAPSALPNSVRPVSPVLQAPEAPSVAPILRMPKPAMNATASDGLRSARETLPASLAPAVRDAILAERRMIAAERLEYRVGPTEVSHLPLAQITGGIPRPIPLAEQLAQNARAQKLIAEEDAAIAQLADGALRERLQANHARRTCKPEARSFNWVREGIVTKVQNQRMCGSCWAFGALGSMESAYQILMGERHDLSEQYLVNNVESAGPWGKCGGSGHAEPADFLIRLGTFSESEFPYSGVPGESWLRPNAPFRALTWGVIPNTTDDTINLDDLKRGLCEHGPLTVSFIAPPQNYIGGVLTRFFPKNQPSDHTVLLVGWDDTERVWIIKNSWGTGWGENAFGDRDGEDFPFGYARVRYGAHRLPTHASWIQPRRTLADGLVMKGTRQTQPSPLIKNFKKRHDAPVVQTGPAPAPDTLRVQDSQKQRIDWTTPGMQTTPMKPLPEPLR